jgi:hypothetical protein
MTSDEEPSRAELLLLLEQAVKQHPDLGRMLSGEDQNEYIYIPSDSKFLEGRSYAKRPKN